MGAVENLWAATSDLIVMVRSFPGGRVTDYRLGLAAGRAGGIVFMLGLDLTADEFREAVDEVLRFCDAEAKADRLFVGMDRGPQVKRLRVAVQRAVREYRRDTGTRRRVGVL